MIVHYLVISMSNFDTDSGSNIYLKPDSGVGVHGCVNLVREHGLHPLLFDPLKLIHLLTEIGSCTSYNNKNQEGS